jgi:hypothetical protein
MDDDDLRYWSWCCGICFIEPLCGQGRGLEDLPDDLTPFITRTTLDPTSGGAFGDVWKCDYNANGISTPVSLSLDSLTMRLGYN